MNSPNETLHGFGESFSIESSLLLLTPRFVSSLGTVALLLLASVTHWYLNRPRKLSLPVVRNPKDGGNWTDSLEEAKRMVSLSMLARS
jgi:hypothetical protein